MDNKERQVEELSELELLSIAGKLQIEAQRINAQLIVIDKEIKARVEAFEKETNKKAE